MSNLGWTIDDSHHVVIREKEVAPPPGAKGEIVDIWFPSEVLSNQQWYGWVEGKNIGAATGTFRFRVDGQATEPSSLPPGGSMRTTINGVGPAEFTIYLERRTPAGWVTDDLRHVRITRATQAPTRKATRMVVTMAPPSRAALDERWRFEGYLEDVYGNRLAKKLVKLHYQFDGNVITVKMYTPSDGKWSFYPCGGATVPMTFTTYAYFEGDAYYTGSKTPTYTTVVS